MKIGFTVGVWDVFHEGHTNFLRECRKHCDYLHVAVMTDFWCRVQKGASRPHFSLAKRMADLRASGLVDNVVIMDTLDMRPYLAMCDVWIKGVDQQNMRPDEYPCTVYIDRTPGVSTTQLLETGKQ